jgi:serine/threonine-protein kinase
VVQGYVDPRRVRAQAREAARQAVALDDSLAEAHTALAAYLHVFDWDWTAAEREYRRAIALDPNEPTAHLWYGLLLEEQGRFNDALVERKRALELDPLAPNTGVASSLRKAGRYEEARAAFQEVIDQHPGYWQAHDGLAQVLEETGNLAEAARFFERAADLAGRTPQATAGLARVLALSGKRAQAKRLVADLRVEAERTRNYPPVVATALAAIGDRSAAMVWLDSSFVQRHPQLIEIGVNACYEPFRHDPGFQELLRRVGLAR